MSFVCTEDLLNVVRGSKQQAVVFTVGNDTSCSKAPTTRHCNGPLPAGRKFSVKVFTCTDKACSETSSSGPFVTAANTEEPSNTGTIAGAISGVLLAIIIIAVVLLLRVWRRRKEENKSHQASNGENGTGPAVELKEIIQPEQVELVIENKPIVISEFEQSLFNFKMENSDHLQKEFTQLTKLSPQHETEEGLKPVNKPANRWTNIIPFDHSRVKLSVRPTQEEEEEPQSDYVNANYVPGVRNPKRYIATQGPLDRTVGDFWRMVWEQGVYVIVMLSQFEELDKRTQLMKQKVARYFPDEEESKSYHYDVIRVNRTGKVDNGIWEIRTLKLCHMHTRKYRFVKHFLFKSWTDHEADISPDRLLEFVNLVRQESSTSSRPEAPLVVHCSAGVGRTGTFLVADYLNEYLEGLAVDAAWEGDFVRGTVDVFGTVLMMRNYRTTLVQTKAQYEFIHQAVEELISRKMKYFHSEDDNNIYENQLVAQDENDNDDENTPIYANAGAFCQGNDNPAFADEDAEDAVDGGSDEVVDGTRTRTNNGIGSSRHSTAESNRL